MVRTVNRQNVSGGDVFRSTYYVVIKWGVLEGFVGFCRSFHTKAPPVGNLGAPRGLRAWLLAFPSSLLAADDKKSKSCL